MMRQRTPSARRTLAAVVCMALGTAVPLTAQRVDTLRMRLVWEVAEGLHAAADSLGLLSGIAVDRRGTVYVTDAHDARVWVFDSSGRSLPAIGRKGKGPGEFESPTGAAIGPDELLYVRDVVHVSRFAYEARTGVLSRFVDSYRGPTFADWTSRQASRFDANGRLYYPQFNDMRRGGGGTYQIFSVAGVLVDSLVVPTSDGAPGSTAYYQTGPSGGRTLRGLNHVPFAAVPSSDVTPRGTLVLADGRSYMLREVDATGRVIRVFRRDTPPQAIPASERRDSLEALRSRIDSIPVPIAQVRGMPDDVRALRLPSQFPPVMVAYAARDGSVWVRRWMPGNQDRSVFDVFSADGELRTVVVLPRRVELYPTPELSLSRVAAIGVHRESGAHSILVFRSER